MKFEVVFSEEARREALEAAAFIARDSPRNAERWMLGIEQAIEDLDLFPSRLPIAPESRYLGCELRHLVYKSHRIIFVIDEKARAVVVLHVRHAARRAMGEPDEPMDDELPSAD